MVLLPPDLHTGGIHASARTILQVWVDTLSIQALLLQRKATSWVQSMTTYLQAMKRIDAKKD